MGNKGAKGTPEVDEYEYEEEYEEEEPLEELTWTVRLVDAPSVEPAPAQAKAVAFAATTPPAAAPIPDDGYEYYEDDQGDIGVPPPVAAPQS